jgi:hypothetical protein
VKRYEGEVLTRSKTNDDVEKELVSQNRKRDTFLTSTFNSPSLQPRAQAASPKYYHFIRSLYINFAVQCQPLTSTYQVP